MSRTTMLDQSTDSFHSLALEDSVLQTSRVRSPATADGGGDSASAAVPSDGRRPYAQPRLTAYGDLRGLTLGGSPGVGESGMPFNFRPLGAGREQP